MKRALYLAALLASCTPASKPSPIASDEYDAVIGNMAGDRDARIKHAAEMKHDMEKANVDGRIATIERRINDLERHQRDSEMQRLKRDPRWPG